MRIRSIYKPLLQAFALLACSPLLPAQTADDLIKKGAKLCEGVEDILSEFEYLFPPTNRPASPAETGTLPAMSLSENEQKAFAVIEKYGTAIDEIIRQSGLPESSASLALFSL